MEFCSNMFLLSYKMAVLQIFKLRGVKWQFSWIRVVLMSFYCVVPCKLERLDREESVLLVEMQFLFNRRSRSSWAALQHVTVCVKELFVFKWFNIWYKRDSGLEVSKALNALPYSNFGIEYVFLVTRNWSFGCSTHVWSRLSTDSCDSFTVSVVNN